MKCVLLQLNGALVIAIYLLSKLFLHLTFLVLLEVNWIASLMHYYFSNDLLGSMNYSTRNLNLPLLISKILNVRMVWLLFLSPLYLIIMLLRIVMFKTIDSWLVFNNSKRLPINVQGNNECKSNSPRNKTFFLTLKLIMIYGTNYRSKARSM